MMGYMIAYSTRPLLRIYLLMKLCGLYINDHRTPKHHLVVHAIYCSIIWSFASFDVIRILMLFYKSEPFGAQLVNKVLTLLAYSASLIVYTSSFYARNYFLAFHDNWVQILRHRSKSNQYRDYSTHLRNVSRGLFAVFLVMPLGLFIYHLAYVVHSTPELDVREILIPALFKDLQPTPFYVLCVLHIILKTISTLGGCSFASLIIMVSAILSKEFLTLKEEFVEAASERGWLDNVVDERQTPRMFTFPTSESYYLLESTRLLHNQITRLLTVADNIFSVCIGMALVCAMTMTILIIYNSAMSYSGMIHVDAFVIYVAILIIFAAAAQMVIVGGSLAVNIAVREYNLYFKSLSFEIQTNKYKIRVNIKLLLDCRHIVPFVFSTHWI